MSFIKSLNFSENIIQQKQKNIYLSKLNPNRRAKINSAFDVINVKMIQLL